MTTDHPVLRDATMYGIPIKFNMQTNVVIPAHWIFYIPLMLCLHTHIVINELCGTDYPFPIKYKR